MAATTADKDFVHLVSSALGANSVVTKDIPDYCVAVGSPAKIVKRYDFNLNTWVEVK